MQKCLISQHYERREMRATIIKNIGIFATKIYNRIYKHNLVIFGAKIQIFKKKNQRSPNGEFKIRRGWARLIKFGDFNAT